MLPPGKAFLHVALYGFVLEEGTLQGTPLKHPRHMLLMFSVPQVGNAQNTSDSLVHSCHSSLTQVLHGIFAATLRCKLPTNNKSAVSTTATTTTTTMTTTTTTTATTTTKEHKHHHHHRNQRPTTYKKQHDQQNHNTRITRTNTTDTTNTTATHNTLKEQRDMLMKTCRRSTEKPS